MPVLAPRLAAALRGVSGILVTPFGRDDVADPTPLEPIIARAVAAGVHALTVNGNTSEFYSLSFVEAKYMLAHVIPMIAGRVAVIAGVGRSVNEAERLARGARDAGADAVMVHQPPDPFCAPRGILTYVRRVAEAAELPIVLYLRNASMGAERIAELVSVPGVVAVKWATPQPLLMAETMRLVEETDVTFICGLAEPWAPTFYGAGARGFTSGLINVAPECSVAIHRWLEAGDYAAAREAIDAIAPFETLRAQEEGGANVSVVKAALRLMGSDVGPARPPAAWPLTLPAEQQLRQLLAQWGLCDVRPDEPRKLAS